MQYHPEFHSTPFNRTPFSLASLKPPPKRVNHPLPNGNQKVGLKDVYSAEIKPQAKTKIIEIMKIQKKQMNLGGTMRLGETEVKFAKDSKIAKIYGCLKIGERHRFEMNNEYIAPLEKKGMVFSGFFAGSSFWLFRILLLVLLLVQSFCWIVGFLKKIKWFCGYSKNPFSCKGVKILWRVLEG